MADEDEINYDEEYSDDEAEAPKTPQAAPSAAEDEQQTQRTTGQMETMKQEAERAAKEIASLKKSVEKLSSENNALSGLKAKVEDLEAKATEADGLRRRIKELEQNSGSSESLNKQIDELQQQLDDKIVENSDLDAAVQDKDGEIRELRTRLDAAKARADSAEAKAEEAATSKGGMNAATSSGEDASTAVWVEQMTLFAVKNELDVAKGLKDGERLNQTEAYESLGEITMKYRDVIRKWKEYKAKLKQTQDTLAADPNQLMSRIKDLEEELRLALGAAEDIRALKAKMMQLIERIRVEKDARVRLESESKHSRKKMEMLSDHIEKLMTHLKHEAAAKIRALEQLRASERETLKMKNKAALIHRKSVAKDRFLIELREGSKILEDQLRLMDEKYLELRAKLDFARESGARKVKKAERMAADLRVKYALAGGTGTLDNIPLPSIYGGGSTTMSDTDDVGSFAMTQQSSVTLGSGRKGSKSGHNKKSGVATGGSKEGGPNIDTVIEKIRQKTGGQPEWTDERLKALTASR